MPSPAVLVQRYNRRLQHQSKLIADLERKVAAQAATINTLSAALQHQSYSLQLVSTLFHDRAAETTAKSREPLAKAADAPPAFPAASTTSPSCTSTFLFNGLATETDDTEPLGKSGPQDRAFRDHAEEKTAKSREPLAKAADAPPALPVVPTVSPSCTPSSPLRLVDKDRSRQASADDLAPKEMPNNEETTAESRGPLPKAADAPPASPAIPTTSPSCAPSSPRHLADTDKGRQAFSDDLTPAKMPNDTEEEMTDDFMDNTVPPHTLPFQYGEEDNAIEPNDISSVWSDEQDNDLKHVKEALRDLHASLQERPSRVQSSWASQMEDASDHNNSDVDSEDDRPSSADSGSRHDPDNKSHSDSGSHHDADTESLDSCGSDPVNTSDADIDCIDRIKTIVNRFDDDHWTKLYDYTRKNIPHALLEDPDSDDPTPVNLSEMSPDQLKMFLSEAKSIYYRLQNPDTTTVKDLTDASQT